MDLTLPEGIIFVAATKGNRYADDHSLGVASNGQTTRFTMNSSTNKPITGNGGALITVTVSADEALEPGSLLQATLGNIEMAQLVNDKERKKVTPPDLDFDIEQAVGLLRPARTPHRAGEEGHLRQEWQESNHQVT